MCGPRGGADRRRTFRVGDRAESHSFNLTYHGPIRNITAKTVSIEDDYHGGAGARGTRRLKLYDFCWKNWDFDLAEAEKRNSEWMD